MSEGRRPQRVLYLLNTFDNGGAENGLVRLVEGGAFAGFDLRIVALARGSGAQVAALKALGQTPEVLVDAPRLRAALLPSTILRLLRLVRSVKPDAMVLSLPQANILGRLAAMATGVRLVCSFEHNTDLAKPIYERLFRLTSGRVDWLLADNAATAEVAVRRLYAGSPARRSVLPLVSFPDGPPPERCSPAGALRIVSAGRFTAVKNQRALIEALAAVRVAGVDATLTLYGDGALRADYMALARELGVTAHLAMPGYVADWAERPADLFVLSSRHEGLCIVLLEALHAGLPTVAPLVGGVADYGAEAQVEIVPDVQPATLAAAIVALAQAPDVRAARGAAGRRAVARRFSQAAVMADYAAFNTALHAVLADAE